MTYLQAASCVLTTRMSGHKKETQDCHRTDPYELCRPIEGSQRLDLGFGARSMRVKSYSLLPQLPFHGWV